MFSTLTQGCSYTASFIMSLFSKETWVNIIAGVIGTALIGLVICGLVLNAATISPNVFIAAGVLSIFAAALSAGLYYFNRDISTSSLKPDEPAPESDSGWFIPAFLSNFGM